jgi:hypothetical protein
VRTAHGGDPREGQAADTAACIKCPRSQEAAASVGGWASAKVEVLVALRRRPLRLARVASTRMRSRSLAPPRQPPRAHSAWGRTREKARRPTPQRALNVHGPRRPWPGWLQLSTTGSSDSGGNPCPCERVDPLRQPCPFFGRAAGKPRVSYPEPPPARPRKSASRPAESPRRRRDCHRPYRAG